MLSPVPTKRVEMNMTTGNHAARLVRSGMIPTSYPAAKALLVHLQGPGGKYWAVNEVKMMKLVKAVREYEAENNIEN